jgi:hypothetical protein
VADDWDCSDEHEFIVLRDPDGNEFCYLPRLTGVHPTAPIPPEA